MVVTDSKNGPKSGKFIDIVGAYDARRGAPEMKVERIKEWIQKGAKTSGTVHNLLVSTGVVSGKKVNVLPKKTVAKVEGGEAPVVAAAEAKVAEPST